MTLIKSISGIRGTIGGKVGDNLTPVDAVKFASAYGTWLKGYSKKDKLTVVVGRDARISGPMIHNLVINTLIGLGIDVIDLGLSTTPTVEVAVPLEKADGGIILTASHNPKQWNALKLFNEKGEFLNGSEGAIAFAQETRQLAVDKPEAIADLKTKEGAALVSAKLYVQHENVHEKWVNPGVYTNGLNSQLYHFNHKRNGTVELSDGHFCCNFRKTV